MFSEKDQNRRTGRSDLLQWSTKPHSLTHAFDDVNLGRDAKPKSWSNIIGAVLPGCKQHSNV